MATIEPRDFTITGQWAKNAQTTIPPIPATGVAYRMSNITVNRAQEGTPFNQIWDSASNNQKDYETSGISKMAETYGFIPWSPLTSYIGGASWCMGTDGTPYHAKKDNTNKPPPDATYWESLADYISVNGGGTIIGMCIPFTGTFSGKNPIDVSKGTPLTNWHICDGTDGTPDLRDKFIVGSSTTKPTGSSGGNAGSAIGTISGTVGDTTLTIAQMPNHDHTAPTVTIRGTNGVDAYMGSNNSVTGKTGGGLPHTHSLSGTATITNANITPPYYAMAWIIRTA